MRNLCLTVEVGGPAIADSAPLVHRCFRLLRDLPKRLHRPPTLQSNSSAFSQSARLVCFRARASQSADRAWVGRFRPDRPFAGYHVDSFICASIWEVVVRSGSRNFHPRPPALQRHPTPSDSAAPAQVDPHQCRNLEAIMLNPQDNMSMNGTSGRCACN